MGDILKSYYANVPFEAFPIDVLRFNHNILEILIFWNTKHSWITVNIQKKITLERVSQTFSFYTESKFFPQFIAKRRKKDEEEM